MLPQPAFIHRPKLITHSDDLTAKALDLNGQRRPRRARARQGDDKDGPPRLVDGGGPYEDAWSLLPDLGADGGIKIDPVDVTTFQVQCHLPSWYPTPPSPG